MRPSRVAIFATPIPPSLMDRHTVAMHFVRAAVARLGTRQRAQVLAAASIPEHLLAEDGARVPAQAFSALWLAVSEALDDEFFGLDRRAMKVGSFALLCQAALAADTLGGALRVLLRGLRTALDDVEGRLVLPEGTAAAGAAAAEVQVVNRIAAEGDRLFADETFLVLVHGIVSWLAAARWPLSAVAFQQQRPGHADEHRRMFGAPVVYGEPRTALRFDAAWLARPVAQQPAALRSFLRAAPQSVFVRYRDHSSLAVRVRRHLRRAVGQSQWPDLAEMAAAFSVSTTTLRRHLEADGVHFQALKDEVRRDAAIHLLCTTPQTVGEIAAGVGFQDASTFRRAFKSWTGVQPSAYRRAGAA